MTSTNTIFHFGDIFFTIVFLLLVILFFVSLTLFLKSRSGNQKKQIVQTQQIEQKLDRIIDLLENEKKLK
ncbi:DUF4083 family protein [Sporosarcina cyprini]|uniref:DUF4083 family protein n=1 Tax=Sporosarcina cyprini TaxID=2910523 RepID=UPI001EE09EFE|nr:DUF4083 domain-containing protein [Sporosarcina cyprini]